MAITVLVGTTQPSRSVALSGGRQAILTASSDDPNLPSGAWAKDGVAMVPAESGQTLLVTMTVSGDQAGSYTYQPSGEGLDAAPAVTIRKKSFWNFVLRLPVLLTLIGVIFILALSTCLLVVWAKVPAGKHPTEITVRAYLFAALILIVFLALVELAGRVSKDHSSGLVGLFAGSDQRTSTSKFQYLMWTFLIGFALAYVAGRTLISDDGQFTCTTSPGKNCISADNWTTYLLLLGLPSGVAVVAKGVVSYKVQNQTVQKTDNASGISLADLATDDAGVPDLVDIQYLLFNLIAIAYVLAAFITKGTLPDIPDLLLGLTSAAAGAYVLNKSLQTNAPVLTSVAPSVLLAGQSVRVTGQNLFPDGISDNHVDVIVGGVRTLGTRIPGSADTITFVAPAGMSAADPTVRVITAAHVQTDGLPVSFGTITIYGWKSEIPPAAAGPVGLAVGGLPDDLAGIAAVVRIGGLTTPDGLIRDSTLNADKPATTATSVEVSVFWNGQSAVATLPVLPPAE